MPPAEIVGAWAGDAQVVVVWCNQKTLPIKLQISVDGTVKGKVGDATLVNARLKTNRGDLGRWLNIKTDYIISGDLSGPIVAAEHITRAGVNIPFNLVGQQLVGGLHSTGSKLTGKEGGILSAARMTLRRM